ncbi:hypothetical protein M970_110500 [Encephalitozoon cuniculi EcunIII-L]|uniref:Uncharacterized protein n=1 Tax=Encephalitozoon cuniculi TaxID=6035 RepID=M1JHR2_ENCCN|nr:hypothetical protein ECU11_0520 [Encephalitozoon cuniculi]KMV65009.1 hypothetical protein M970_110500 [Encephalitozoon cuniculi EcunIII-L]UYI26251.1 hypothetical protein J0A71_01g00680 [Encephalitozoon cuniculi]
MEVSGGKRKSVESIRSSLGGAVSEANSGSGMQSPFPKRAKVSPLWKDRAATEGAKEEDAAAGCFTAQKRPSMAGDKTDKCNGLSAGDLDSSLDSDESDECSGLLSMYHVKGLGSLYKNLKVLRISDMVLEKSRMNHPNPKFLCNIEGGSNYTMVLSDLYFKQRTKSLKKELKLKQLIEEFFSALDRFVLIANYCLKSTEIEDGDEDFNFALQWVRDAFHWLGIEGAKYYARKSPGPYSGWVSDVEFLMNRYFFSPEFNHVNGFDIEQSIHEGYRFVESSDGKFYLSYQPYPGYYDASEENKQFCPNCNLTLPQHLSLLDGDCHLDGKPR